MKQTRILLLDDHELFRECLARRLESEPDLQIVAGCGSVEEALGVIAHDPVDMVLLDIDLGPEHGSSFLEQALARGFRGRVLIVTGLADDPSAARLIAQGAHGLFLKQNPLALLIESIRAVMDGRTWVDPSYWRTMQREETSAKKIYRKPKLTERERTVLQGVMEGLANKEIATRLETSEASVKAALQQLFEKSGARTRSQLVRIALENWQDSLLR
jgi:DNA-binding NarL/FixJ family response regulator